MSLLCEVFALAQPQPLERVPRCKGKMDLKDLPLIGKAGRLLFGMGAPGCLPSLILLPYS